MDTEPFVSEGDIWCSRHGKKYSYRRKVKVTATKRVAVRELINQLSFVKNKNSWGVAFFSTLRGIPNTDFEFISKAMGI